MVAVVVDFKDREFLSQVPNPVSERLFIVKVCSVSGATSISDGIIIIIIITGEQDGWS